MFKVYYLPKQIYLNKVVKITGLIQGKSIYIKCIYVDINFIVISMIMLNGA